MGAAFHLLAWSLGVPPHKFQAKERRSVGALAFIEAPRHFLWRPR